MKRLSAWLAMTGAVFLASSITLAVSQAPLGSPIFFGCAGAAAAAYLALLVRFWNEPAVSSKMVVTAVLLSLAFRAPLIAPRVNFDSDMVRYLWDGRVQVHGFNPYHVIPSDPAVASIHTDETRRMPSLRTRTPYPPAAQLFFRLVVSIHDSTRTMKIALVACDLLTMLIVWRWLPLIGRPQWLVVAYAWNPLVVLEVAHSGHIDVLGALWVVTSAYWLTRRRTTLASIALVMAIAAKLLPIVLLPLFWRRIRLRDAFGAGAFLAVLYLLYTQQGVLPLGAVPNVVAHIRFNGPSFRSVAQLLTPQGAALFAVASGLVVAAWCRWRLGADDPSSWAWPMATALAGAPVIYPWYLLYFTPFLFTIAVVPLTAWTLTVISTYIVWQRAYEYGARWAVPSAVMLCEYALPALVAAAVLGRSRIGALLTTRQAAAAKAADSVEGIT
jgi:glycosyl transferase family 87